jgi:monoamine oxidase
MSERDSIIQAGGTEQDPRDTFEFGVTKDWSLDPYAGGIGPLFRPFEMSGRLYTDVIRPVHRVWFANDGCDRRHRRRVEGSIKGPSRTPTPFTPV